MSQQEQQQQQRGGGRRRYVPPHKRSEERSGSGGRGNSNSNNKSSESTNELEKEMSKLSTTASWADHDATSTCQKWPDDEYSGPYKQQPRQPVVIVLVVENLTW